MFRRAWFRACAAALLALTCPVRAASPIMLQQADGTELRLEAPAQRLVALAPHLDELVFEAGAGERLLASVEYSDFPPEVLDLPRIGDAFRIDVERIMALNPDLVLAWDSGNPSAAVSQLRALGIPVLVVEIRQPQGIADTLEQIGRATGTGGA